MRAIQHKSGDKPAKARRPGKPTSPEGARPPRRWLRLPRFRPKVPKTGAAPDFILAPYVRPKARAFGIALLAVAAVACVAYGYMFATMAPFVMIPFAFPILVLGALCIWALPDLGPPPTRALERLFFVFMAGLLWPNYLAISLPGLPWITVLRLTGFPLAFLLLYSISSSQAYRSEAAKSLNAVPIVWKGVAAFAIYQTLSVGLSNAIQVSIDKLIATQVSWTAIFFVSAYVFAKPGRVERWAMILWMMAIGLSLVATREYMLGHLLWAGHVPSFLVVEDDAVGRAMNAKMRAGTERYRAQATFSSPLGLGELLALCTPFVLHYIAGPFKPWHRMLAALSFPLILNAILLTDTRLGFVGFLISCVLYLFAWGALEWRQRKGSLIGPAIVLSYPAIFVMFATAVLTVPRLRVMTLGGGQHQASSEAREAQIAQGIPIILRHPFGHGIARGGVALGFRNGAGTLTVDTYYLLIALDYGIFGFLIFYGLFIAGIFNGFLGSISGPLKREQTLLLPITIALVVYFIIKSIYSGVDNQPIAYMMLGAVSALIYRIKVENGTMKGRSKA